MEHESHLPESSLMSISVKIFGGAIALALAGGLLYVVYMKSGLDASANVADAYDNCKSSILSSMASSNKIQFLNTPENSELVEAPNGYTMLMKLRITDRSGPREVSYSCAVAKHGDWLQPLRDFVNGR